ncbi:hypothetical protein Tco_1561869 [Tanacetum coccineum]
MSKTSSLRFADIISNFFLIATAQRDPLPFDDLVDFPLMDQLNLNRTLIRRNLKEFLCAIGLSRTFVDPDIWVFSQWDVEIVDLKARLEKSEAEVANVIELCKRVSDLEPMVAVKVGEVATLNTHNSGLSKKVYALKLVRGELDSKVAQLTADCDGLRDQVMGEGKMREEFVSQQDAAERRFSVRAATLDARIVDVSRDIDNILYPHMLTAIAGRRWVVGHDIRLAVHKCARFVECRSALVEAYDTEIEVKYVVAVSEFKGVSFPLLDELESLKDSPLALIMFALTLKDDHGNTNVTPKFCQFQPSLDQVTVPIYSESGSIDCGVSSSSPPHDSFLGVADYQVSTLVLSGDGGTANQPPVIQPPDDLFDVSILDKSGDA